MAEEIQLLVSPDEVRFIAILRAIKSVNKKELIAAEDAGIALSLLQLVEPKLSDLEKNLESSELKVFLRGYITGLAASKVQELPQEYWESRAENN